MAPNSYPALELIRQHCEKARASLVAVVSPDLIAGQVAEQLDPECLSPHEIRQAALIYFRTEAASILRRWRSDERKNPATGQTELFERQLQDYYGVTRDGDHVHVKRSALTADEREQIIKALRTCSRGYSDHADALERESETLQAA